VKLKVVMFAPLNGLAAYHAWPVVLNIAERVTVRWFDAASMLTSLLRQQVMPVRTALMPERVQHYMILAQAQTVIALTRSVSEIQ
jgi:hypothetical protein